MIGNVASRFLRNGAREACVEPPVVWMQRTLFVLGMLAWLAGPARAGDEWLAGQKKFHQLKDKAAVDRLLADLRKQYPDFVARLRAVALLRVGTPYVLGCLGEEKGPDAQPVFRLDLSDCTVHVLTSAALAHAASYAEARGWMTRLNYYPAPGRDPVSYANRVHFTEDRLQTSAYFKDVTARVAPAAALESRTLTLNRKRDGSALLEIPWEKKITVRYIPAAKLNKAMLDRLPVAAGVAFIREKDVPLGLIIGHEGMVIDRGDLVHADSISKRVQRVSLLEYVKKNSDWFDGVVLYEFR